MATGSTLADIQTTITGTFPIVSIWLEFIVSFAVVLLTHALGAYALAYIHNARSTGVWRRLPQIDDAYRAFIVACTTFLGFTSFIALVAVGENLPYWLAAIRVVFGTWSIIGSLVTMGLLLHTAWRILCGIVGNGGSSHTSGERRGYETVMRTRAHELEEGTAMESFSAQNSNAYDK